MKGAEINNFSNLKKEINKNSAVMQYVTDKSIGSLA